MIFKYKLAWETCQLCRPDTYRQTVSTRPGSGLSVVFPAASPKVWPLNPITGGRESATGCRYSVTHEFSGSVTVSLQRIGPGSRIRKKGTGESLAELFLLII